MYVINSDTSPYLYYWFSITCGFYVSHLSFLHCLFVLNCFYSLIRNILHVGLNINIKYYLLIYSSIMHASTYRQMDIYIGKRCTKVPVKTLGILDMKLLTVRTMTPECGSCIRSTIASIYHHIQSFSFQSIQQVCTAREQSINCSNVDRMQHAILQFTSNRTNHYLYLYARLSV